MPVPRTPDATPVPSYDEQLQRLADLAADGLLDQRTLEELAGLHEVAAEESARSHDEARIPALAVVSAERLATADALARVRVRGRTGRVDMNPLEPHDFAPIPAVEVPGPAYVLLDVDLGARFRDVTPESALPRIIEEGRTPLTIDEGVSLLLEVPDALVTRTAFSLLASRRGDQRVPALWMSSGAPRLGWCWDRNPHSWLGSASAALRVGLPRPGS
jgi:Family of unknown function (DUF5701)